MRNEYIFTKKKKNIHDFIKNFKNKTFLLKNNSIEFEVKLSKIKSVINSKLDYYSITTIENAVYGVTYVFAIIFFYKKPSFKNVYIQNISKTEKYSGTDVINFIINFLKSFKQVKKVYLHDSVDVSCKNSDDRFDLSLYKLITSYNAFYQKFGFRLIMEHNEEDCTKLMVKLAKKVSTYKIKNILNTFQKIIKLVEKYKEKVIIKIIVPLNMSLNIIIKEILLKEFRNIIHDIGYLYFIMTPYKKYTFGKYIEILNNKKCFMLSQLLTTFSNIKYFEFNYEKDKIISEFLLDYNKLLIYRNNIQWKGIFVKKIA
jgi:hypothetical protein